MQRESLAATLATTAGQHTASLTSALPRRATAGLDTGDPEAQKITADNALVLGAAARPTLSPSRAVLRKLRTNSNFRDRVKYTTGGPVTNDAIKAFFNIDYLFVSDNVKNTANEGATDSISTFWGTNAIFFVYQPGVDMESVGFGAMYMRTSPLWQKVVIDEAPRSERPDARGAGGHGVPTRQGIVDGEATEPLRGRIPLPHRDELIHLEAGAVVALASLSQETTMPSFIIKRGGIWAGGKLHTEATSSSSPTRTGTPSTRSTSIFSPPSRRRPKPRSWPPPPRKPPRSRSHSPRSRRAVPSEAAGTLPRPSLHPRPRCGRHHHRHDGRRQWFKSGFFVGPAATTTTAASRIDNVLAGSITFDFASQSILCEDSTGITVTGAAVNDPCFVGMPTTLTASGLGRDATYSCYVSAADTVKVRHCPAGTADNPASATCTVRVISPAPEEPPMKKLALVLFAVGVLFMGALSPLSPAAQLVVGRVAPT